MSEPNYSPGLEGVVAGETAISTIAGGLQYRGYSIEELAQQGTFEEVAYLVLRGELPNAGQLREFEQRLEKWCTIAPEIVDFVRRIPAGVSMMDVLRSATSMLAHWDPEVGNNSHEANVRKAERLLAQLPVAMASSKRWFSWRISSLCSGVGTTVSCCWIIHFYFHT